MSLTTGLLIAIAVKLYFIGQSLAERRDKP